MNLIPFDHVSVKLYKDRVPLDDRSKEYQRMKEQYPNGAPVVFVKDVRSKCPDIDKNSFCIQMSFVIAQVITFIRARLNLSSRDAIFLYANGQICSGNDTISSLYQRHVSNDGFLYFVYASEEVFG